MYWVFLIFFYKGQPFNEKLMGLAGRQNDISQLENKRKTRVGAVISCFTSAFITE